MSETPNETPQRRPHSKPAAGPYLELDLTRELEELLREPEWKTGHNAKTLLKFDNLRVVLTGLKAGSSIPPHQTEGRISIHTLQVASKCGQKDARSTCLLEDCSLWIRASGMTSRRSKTARFF